MSTATVSALAVAAREGARTADGRFGEQQHTDPGQLALSADVFDVETIEGLARLAAETRWCSDEAVQARLAEPGADREEIILTASGRRDQIMEHFGIDPDSPHSEEQLARTIGAGVADHAQREAGVAFADIAEAAQEGREEKEQLGRRLTEAKNAHHAIRDAIDARTRNDPRVRAAHSELRQAWADPNDAVRLSELAQDRYAETVRAVSGADPDAVHADELSLEAKRLQRLYADHDGGECRDQLAALAHSYRSVLARVRPMGGRLQFGDKTTRRAADAFQEAASCYPSDWVDASNTAPVPLLAKVQKKRAHYAHGHQEQTRKRMPWVRMTRLSDGFAARYESDPETDVVAWREGMEVPYGFHPPADPSSGEHWVAHEYEVHDRYSRGALPDSPPAGKGWQVWTDPARPERRYWRRPRTKLRTLAVQRTAEITTNVETDPLAGNSGTFAVSVHELAHRAEYTTDGITRIEAEFLARRTADSALVSLYPGRRRAEVGRADHFVDAYIGREYPSDAREVLSCGTQALFGGQLGGLAGAGRYRPDPEHRDLVLGMLACAGNAARR